MRSLQRASGSTPRSSRAPERALAPRSQPADGSPDRVERREGDADARTGSGSRREGASRVESIAAIDIRHIADPEEMAKVHALAARLAQSMRARLVRRMRSRSSGRRLDLRRIIHRSIARGGTPIDLVWRKRKQKPLRLVVLLDASGSMSLYTSFFVRFCMAW